MEPGKLQIEVEVGPRFEIFYALHKLFAPPAPNTERWRKAAMARLGSRAQDDARDLAPEPLMWAILADTTLATGRVGSFAELIDAMEKPSARQFKSTIIAGIPTVRGSNLVATFKKLLADPEDYRRRLVVLLRAFWARGFSDDFAGVQPELERMARQLGTAKAQATSENAGSTLGIPIDVNGAAGELAAGRTGYTIPLVRVGRIVVLPSAFNLNRWWTKRDDGKGPVDFFFPLNDGTIGPNDWLREMVPERVPSPSALDVETKPANAKLRPEMVFRALGDTTRYAIATILARAPTTPSDLSRQLQVSKPTITHHVHALRDAGLIVEGGDGGRLALDRSKLEQLSVAAVAALFASEGRLKLDKTRKKGRPIRGLK